MILVNQTPPAQFLSYYPLKQGLKQSQNPVKNYFHIFELFLFLNAKQKSKYKFLYISHLCKNRSQIKSNWLLFLSKMLIINKIAQNGSQIIYILASIFK